MDKPNITLPDEPRYVSPLEWINGPATADFPNADAWKERVMLHMVHYFRSNLLTYRLQDFCDAYGYRLSYMRKLLQRHPALNEVWQDVKPILGNKRYRHSILVTEGVKDGDKLWKDIHLYDDEFDRVNKYHSDLRKTDQEVNKEVTLKLKYVKETDEVPLCPTE